MLLSYCTAVPRAVDGLRLISCFSQSSGWAGVFFVCNRLRRYCVFIPRMPGTIDLGSPNFTPPYFQTRSAHIQLKDIRIFLQRCDFFSGNSVTQRRRVGVLHAGKVFEVIIEVGTFTPINSSANLSETSSLFGKNIEHPDIRWKEM